jgi:hypothetical protein
VCVLAVAQIASRAPTRTMTIIKYFGCKNDSLVAFVCENAARERHVQKCFTPLSFNFIKSCCSSMSSKKADTEVWRCQLLSTLNWWGSELGQIWLTFILTPIYSGQKNKQLCLSYLFLAFFVRPVQLEFLKSTFKCKKSYPRETFFKAIYYSRPKKCVESQAFSWLADASERKAQESRMRARDAGRKTSTAVTADGLF